MNSPEAAISLRDRLAIDEQPGIQRFVQSSGGQLAVAAIAMLVLWPHLSPGQILIAVPSALLMARFPALRAQILFAGTWIAAVLGAWFGWVDLSRHIELVTQAEFPAITSGSSLAVSAVLACGVFCAGLIVYAARHPQSIVVKRPLVSLLGLLTAMIVVEGLDVTRGLPHLVIWSLIFAFTPYLWFMPYAMAEARSGKLKAPLGQMGFLRSFWSPTYLPFGKGGNYLNKHLGKTPDEIAIAQIKGVKLLLWAACLHGIRLLLDFSLSPFVPEINTAIDAFLSGHPYPVVTGWQVIILSTIEYSLMIAMWAHLFIGIARMAGYRLPRGSWRPLESRTLMDYFNRFHFYFKEMLVDYFFLPTFFKVFKKHPRLRMFFATFMAAGVGNALWHFLRDIDVIYTAGLLGALEGFTSYLFYCVILATGVGLSQVRADRGVRPPTGFAGRMLAFLFVWSFVALLRVFSDESRNHTLMDRLSFMGSLFGVS